MDFTDKEQIFESIYFGRYDTPKKLNRSTTSIPPQYIESIEAGNVTSEDIKKLSEMVPIFIYKTCITIHGNLPEIQRQYVGGYKNLIQNKNNSLEIRHSAIDSHLKNELSQLLTGHWNKHQDSAKGIYFVKTKRTQDKTEAINTIQEQREYIKSIQLTGCKARLYVSGYNYFGMYYISTFFVPILIETDIINLASQLTGINTGTLTSEKQKRDEEEKQRHQKYLEHSQLRQAKQAQLEATRRAVEDKMSKEYKAQEIQPNATYFCVITTTTGNQAYKIIQTEKGTFGRVKYKWCISDKLEVNPENFKEGKQVKPNEITRQKTFRI